MNRKLKKALRAALEAPPPADKERFLKTLHYPRSTYSDFLLSQFCYIRKRVWALSLAFVFVGWAIAFLTPMTLNLHAEKGEVWALSATLPFLAFISVKEIYRSSFFCMAELEMSCRFSLSQIIMARISILGCGNFTVLALLLIFIDCVSPYGVLRLIFYLLMPYLITCGICLLILNRMRGQGGTYACAAAACFVCVANTVLYSIVPLLYSGPYLHYWMLLFAAAVLLIGIQMHKLLKQMEDKTWNLLLTE